MYWAQFWILEYRNEMTTVITEFLFTGTETGINKSTIADIGFRQEAKMG